MTNTTAERPRRQEADLRLARRIIGLVLLAATAAQAALWILPKGDIPALWLLCAVPAAVFLALVWVLADPRDRESASLGLRIAACAILAVLWMGGLMFFTGFEGLNPVLSFVWQAGFMLWPLLMAVGLLARVLLRRMVPAASRRDAVEANRRREIAYEQRLEREMNSQLSPTAPGRTTGFEPAALADVELGDAPFLHGVPGAGLAGSGFGQEQIDKGQQGEMNFARALARAGSLSRFATFWSVQMPDETVGASTRFSSDIDCVLVTGRTVYLLDMKNYTQGDVTWFVEDGHLRMVDNPTGGYIGRPREMSRNMELAASRVRQKLVDLGIRRRVEPLVVFMPTEAGLGTIDPGIRWPGDVPARGLDTVLEQLSAEPDFDPRSPDSEHLVRVFRWLVKDESGTAPRPGAQDEVQDRGHVRHTQEEGHDARGDESDEGL
ncbi:nuclease-related domain-containing protein, partial [Brachybacterium hainanense]